MKILLPFFFLLLSATVFAQVKQYAAGAYAENGRLISLTNLQDLSDCPTKNVAGKVKKIKVNGDTASFRLGGRDEKINVEVDLSRLDSRERRVVFLDMIRSRYNLRVAGYVCTEDGPINAFSLYRE
jgi:hypothetical protein